MQAETTYIAIFVLAGFFILLCLWRFIRAAGSAFGQIRFEAERDRYQHQRIAWEKERQYQALRRSTRKINGKRRNVGWNDKGQRAHRTYHYDDAADEVFDSASDFRAMDVRTPWGWPSSSGKKINRVGYRPGRRTKSGIGKSIADFFRTKQVVDDEYRARRERNIRHLVEDRFGRACDMPQMEEVEWQTPALPDALLKERASDQMHARKSGKTVVEEMRRIPALKLVTDLKDSAQEKQRALGQ